MSESGTAARTSERRGEERPRRGDAPPPERTRPTAERKAPESKGPEKKAPEKKAPEKKAPEKKAPEKKAPEKESPEEKGPEKSSSGLTAGRAARKALEHFTELGGSDVEQVVGVQHEDGRWTVVLEVLEDPHVPSTSDVLAEYEVSLDDSGELLGFRRVHRYVRGRVGG
nr:gas vesicle protein [Cellulosimicrobium cellulans]